MGVDKKVAEELLTAMGGGLPDAEVDYTEVEEADVMTVHGAMAESMLDDENISEDKASGADEMEVD